MAMPPATTGPHTVSHVTRGLPAALPMQEQEVGGRLSPLDLPVIKLMGTGMLRSAEEPPPLLITRCRSGGSPRDGPVRPSG